MPTRVLEQHFRQGNYVAALLEFERLLVDLPGDDLHSLAWTHFWGAKVKNAQRENFAAVRLMTLAMEYATKVSDWVLIGRIRLDSSAFHRQAGDTTAARDLAHDFLRDLHLYPELANYEGAAHYNLGLIYRCRREFEECELHYTVAENLLRDSPNRRWHLMALQNLAWILYERDKFQAGDRFLDQADLIVEALEDRSAQLTHKYVRAFGALMRGDLNAAASNCVEILAPTSEATNEQRAWATWIMADCAVQLGHHAEAQVLIKQALDLAIHDIKDVRIINYVSATRRKLLLLTRPPDTQASD